MKARREHRIPLCDRAMAILEAAAPYRKADGLIFPANRKGGQLSNMVFEMLLRRLEINCRSAWLPVQLQRFLPFGNIIILGGKRSGPCPQPWQLYGIKLCANGPIRPAPWTHVGMGRIPIDTDSRYRIK